MKPVTCRRIGKVLIITVAGDMKDVNAGEITDHVTQAALVDAVDAIHLNVTRVTAIATAGVATLVRARALARQHGLAFTLGVSYNGPVARTLATTNEWFDDV